MKCPKCAADVDANAVFCSKCGARLAGESTTVVMPPRAAGAVQVSDAPEETLWEGRFSPKAMIGSWIGMGIVDLLLFIVAIYLMTQGHSYWWIPIVIAVLIDFFVVVRYLLKRIGIRYRLSNHRFFHEEGILNRKVNPIDLITINDVAFEQGPIERMMGIGRIKIMSTDTSDPVLSVEGIEDVQNVATMIDKTRREEMMRRRVFYDASPHGHA
jgi:membrane protein YdbS with pleckstrin-like domain